MRLSDYAVGKDNNFTLLRLLAAMMVVFAHSFAVLGLPWVPDVFLDRTGRSFGQMCLDMLFVTSGFLVTASLLNRGDLIEYCWARALRLFPALWVMLLATVFVLAPMVTALSTADYFRSPQMWEYLWKCGTVLGGIRWSLPGVFEAMPLKGEFNGSLWTLPVEAKMYVYGAVAWIALAFAPAFRVTALRIVSPIVAAVLGANLARIRLTGGTFSSSDIAIFMWFYGSALYYWRDKIPTSWGTFAALLAIPALATVNKNAAFVVYLICMAPLVLHLAYLPAGFIRKYNAFGDYSYGVYIYAFPMQQTLAHLIPGISLVALVGGSAAGSFVAAGLSWHFIEKRALSLKHECAQATERALDRVLAKFRAAIHREGFARVSSQRASTVDATAHRRLQTAADRETESRPMAN